MTFVGLARRRSFVRRYSRESHTYYVDIAIVVCQACLSACLRSLFFYEGPNFAVVGVGGDVRCVDRVVTDGEHFAQMTGGRQGKEKGKGKGKAKTMDRGVPDAASAAACRTTGARG